MEKKEDLTKGTVLTENVATIFIMDTLLASADGRKLDELMMEKHKWDREKYDYYKGIYLSWMAERSSNIDTMGNIKSSKWDKLNAEFEKALEKFDEWTPKDRKPIEATKHDAKIHELAIEYCEKTTLPSMDKDVKLMCQRDFCAGFYKCQELQMFTKEQMILVIRKMLDDEGIKYHYVREWLEENLDRVKEEIIKHDVK